ncbi:MAG: NAD(P)-binding protein, partial [Roseomonas sp.]|nr:NAD(P)-binding protein [Roseomonas sp.]
MPPARKHVVILGGGCGGVAAAFWLSSTPALRERFHVTLYTRGWRLGGKGASGRKADAGQRIEEHGLHIWLGFYNNAFRTMQAAFAAMPPGTTGTFTSIADAFSPERTVVFMEKSTSNKNGSAYLPWAIPFPDNGLQPGQIRTGAAEEHGPHPALRKLVRALTDYADSHGAAFPLAEEFVQLTATLEPLFTPIHFSHENANVLGQDRVAAKHAEAELKRFQVTLTEHSKHTEAGIMKWSFPDDLRRLSIVLGWGIAIIIGYLRDIAFARDKQKAYDALNAQEFRDWLKQNHAWNEVLHCAPLQALYDLAFAYPNGETKNPMSGALAAGVTLRLCQELVLGYHGAPLWKMNAGMGDTIFTPLWDALQAQGVDVKLFHALEEVAPSDDGKSIARVRLRQQATTIDDKPYDPFVLVKGLRCWPSEPDWGQLKDGDILKNTAHFERTEDTTCARRFNLTQGQDFDAVILALPPEALKPVTPDLRRNARWSGMLDGSASVATQAFQLWLDVPSKALGFPVNPDNPPPTTAFIEPFATWADMAHLLPAEDWPAGPASPQSIHYFCGPVHLPSNKNPPPNEEAWAEADANAWLP